MYRYDKNLKRAKTPETNQVYRMNRTRSARSSAEGASELRSAETQEASQLVDLAGNQIA